MTKDEWHKKNKWRMHRYVRGVCSECFKTTSLHGGCIHHTTYQHGGGIYNADWFELGSLGKIVWVCHGCHESIHQTKSIDGITKVLKRLPICNECGDEIYTSDDSIEICDLCNGM